MNTDLDKKGIVIPIDAETDFLPINQEATALYDQKVAAYKQKLKADQNLLMGIAAGTLAAVVMAGFWALMAVVTMLKSGFIAVAVGFVVGIAVRYAGKGQNITFRLVGAVLALAGVLVGNMLVVLILNAQTSGMSIADYFAITSIANLYHQIGEEMVAYDALFYSFAVYEGFRFSVRTIKEEEYERAGMK